MFISQSVKLISDNIWIGLVLWHRLDVYNQKLSIHNKCAWVGIHQWLWKVHKGSVLSIELFVGNLFWLRQIRIVFFYTLLNNKNTQFIVNKQYCTKKNMSWWVKLNDNTTADKHIHACKKRYLEVISRSTRFKEFNREKKICLKSFRE